MDTETSIGVQAGLRQAEKARKYLSENNLLRKDLKVSKDNSSIYFPVKEALHILNSYKIIEKEFEINEIKPKSYKEIVSLPDNLKQDLPTSYDVIGDIILIKLPENLTKYQEEIGKSLLKTNKSIKTVCLTQPVSGELRTRNVEVISGEKRTKTIHKEYGLTFNVDVKKTYFSQRLANERKRVANLVKPSEVVVDMFAGVAPFSIMIAKYASPKIIYAIDKNEEAIKLARQNIKRNNVLDKIEAIHTDAKEVCKILNQKNVKADRIIMNLPFSAYLFFTHALKITNNKGVIHLYDILKEDKIQDRINNLRKTAKENKTTLAKLDIRKIKTYAPREFYIGLDITVKKNMPM